MLMRRSKGRDIVVTAAASFGDIKGDANTDFVFVMVLSVSDNYQLGELANFDKEENSRAANIYFFGAVPQNVAQSAISFRRFSSASLRR